MRLTLLKEKTMTETGPVIYSADEHPEKNVSRCTWQINYVSRITKISKRRLESIFIQGLKMRPGVNWTKFYDALMEYLESGKTSEIDLNKAGSLTDSCVGNNGHFIAPEKREGKPRSSDPVVLPQGRRH